MMVALYPKPGQRKLIVEDYPWHLFFYNALLCSYANRLQNLTQYMGTYLIADAYYCLMYLDHLTPFLLTHSTLP